MPDGSTVPVMLFESSNAPRLDAPVVVVLPGLGIPAGYYRLFAERLTSRGMHVALADLRGQGDSRPKPSSASTYGYHELVSVDFPAVFEVVRERFPDATPYALGHSMGGQLASLYSSRIRGRLGGLILVASGSPFHRGFGVARGASLFVGAAAMSLTSSIAGFWPGDRIDIGGFGRQSKVLIDDWSRFARTGKIEPTGADIDYEERIGRLKLPILAITLAGDDMAPRSSMQNLLTKFPRADITTRHLESPRGHIEWIRQPETVVDEVVEWFKR
ncbi:Predicted alpha/beta hydrolase [Rhodococcoides kyotonense]|uniref:Predicted alpha/beta hydrolase n=2 Tax=Rhodococcoides kyotonense TaxID=398843 RepID=A0A239G228_9NOCA|nr:Predicted alpha/beta hydrolase [Rhodococcus kyotonensis]